MSHEWKVDPTRTFDWGTVREFFDGVEDGLIVFGPGTFDMGDLAITMPPADDLDNSE